MSMRAFPLDNMTPKMKNILDHLRSGKTIRVDKSIMPWTHYCGSFRRSGTGKSKIIGMSNARFPIAIQTFTGLRDRGLLEIIQERADNGRYYYKLKDEYKKR